MFPLPLPLITAAQFFESTAEPLGPLNSSDHTSVHDGPGPPLSTPSSGMSASLMGPGPPSSACPPSAPGDASPPRSEVSATDASPAPAPVMVVVDEQPTPTASRISPA